MRGGTKIQVKTFEEVLQTRNLNTQFLDLAISKCNYTLCIAFTILFLVFTDKPFMI